MPGRAPVTARVSGSAARRALARDLLVLCGRTLGAGALTALALVAADKLAGGLAPWPLLVAPPLGVALMAGIGWAIARAWSRARAAAEIDRALGLNDKLSTALAFDSTSADDPFVRWAIDDAERAARSVKLRNVIPWRLEWTWLAWPAVGAAAIAMALFVAPATWSRRGPTLTEQVARRTEAAAEIERARQDAKQALESTLGDAAAAAHEKSLEELQRELAAGTLDAEQARARAAGELQALADELSARSQTGRIGQDRVREALGAMKPGPDAAASPLGEALRQGDLDAAGDAADQLLGQADSLSPEERRDLADQLDGLADAMREPPAPAPDRSAGLSQETQRDLADRGLPPERIEQLSHPTEPEPIARELEQHGAPPEEAQKVAERIAEENRRRQAEQTADDGLQDLRDMLKRGAEELRNPPQPPDPSKQPDQRQNPSKPDQTNSDQSKRDGSKQNGSKEQGDSGDQKPGDKSGQQNGDKQGEPRDGKGQGQPTQVPGAQAPAGQTGPQSGNQGERGPKKDGGQSGDQPGGQKDQPGTKPASEPGAQPGAQGDKQPGQGQPGQGQPGQAPGGEQPDGRPQPGGKQPGGEQGDGSGRQPGNPQGTQPGEGPGQTPGDGAKPTSGGGGHGDGSKGVGQGSKPGSGLEGLRDRLQRLAQDAQQSQRQAQEAEKLRERAQELLDRASPQEREDLRRWAEELAREQRPHEPRPVDTVTIDARGDQPKRPAGEQRVIAEWFSDRPLDRTAAPGALTPDEPFQEAAKGAERAIEQQVVPGRYSDLVRRVFRRYSERSSAPPAQPPR